MPFTASDLATVDAALASGALRVKYADGREVTYQNAGDLIRVRALIVSQLNATAATPTPRMTRVVHVRS